MQLTTAKREELEDLLLDLQHDLGKYLRLPLTFLPPEASLEELRGAIGTALRETRRSPAGCRSAREIWEAFTEELGPVAHHSAIQPVREAVTRALAWETLIDDPATTIDRIRVTGDLSAVGQAIRAALEEIHGSA